MTGHSIGIYNESSLHAVIKRFLEADESKHEIKYKGYIADILNDAGIIEIQTRSFNNMRKKLEIFLKEGEIGITIVFPAVEQKWLIWINADSGEVTKKRKSPKIGTPYAIYEELYKIKYLLLNPRIKFKIIMVDIEEYRKLNGWSDDRKKGSSRVERIPVGIGNVIDIATLGDYKKIIPDLPDAFTSKDFKTASKLSHKNAQTALNVLNTIGAVERTGKRGNSYVYKIAL